MSLPIRLRHTKARSVILRLCVIDYLPVRVRSYTKYSCCTNKNLKQKTEQAALACKHRTFLLLYCSKKRPVGPRDWRLVPLLTHQLFLLQANHKLRKGNGAHSQAPKDQQPPGAESELPRRKCGFVPEPRRHSSAQEGRPRSLCQEKGRNKGRFIDSSTLSIKGPIG